MLVSFVVDDCACTNTALFLPPYFLVEHKVCKQASGMKETGVGLDTLVPGSRFVTSWGVVEVVKDDRATPSGDLSPTIKKLAKNYQAIKTRIDAHNIKIADAIASQLRGRRSKINTLYKTKNVTRRSIFEAYFQGNPHIYRNLKSTLVSRPMPPDPYQPPELCPDRIVECILIPDQRLRFSSTDFDIPTEVKEEMVFSKSPSRLFLQRKLLKEPYVEDLPTYTCANCGRRFISLAGIRYHMSANVCVQKMISEGESRKERQVKIELAAKAIAADKSKIMDMVPNPTLRQGEGKGRKRAKPTAMYPEVLMSLGFKVVKEDMEFTDDIKLPPIFATDKERRDHSRGIHGIDSDNEDLSDLAVNEPGVFLEILKKQLKHHQLEYQRSAADQKHGSMYVGVFKSLGYQKPRKRTTARERRASQRKRRSTKPPPPPKPLPPIIDTRALAHEVDAGRYPSMKRYEDEKHCDICFICRDGGDLVCCNFCCNAEHLKCIRTRFTVKDPEPADDFMCHKCIQFVLQRRNRAERRRLQKQQRDEQRKKEEALEESRLNPGIKKGMEYPYLAERGQEVSELVELLKDAQTRLEQALATSKMNNIRRKVMGCFFTKKEE